MGARPNPVAYLADTIGRAPARPMRIAAMWAYFDETIIREVGQPKGGGPDMLIPKALVIGGCCSSLAKWKEFELKWNSALADEKVSAFHATDFFSFQEEFEWYLDG